MSRVTTKPVFGVSDHVRYKPCCRVTARGLKFRIYEVEGLGYLYSENKGPDQLRGHCFRICKNRVSHDAAHIVEPVRKSH